MVRLRGEKKVRKKNEGVGRRERKRRKILCLLL